MTSRPKYNQYLTSNRRQVPAGLNLKYIPDIKEYNAQLYVQQFVCKMSLSVRKGTSWHKSSFSGKFISKDLMSFICDIFIKTNFQRLRLIRIDADIVQHINLSEIRSVTNDNTRSFVLPWQPLA